MQQVVHGITVRRREIARRNADPNDDVVARFCDFRGLQREDVRKRLDQDVRVVGFDRVRDRIHRPEHRTHIRAFFSRDGIFLRSATESDVVILSDGYLVRVWIGLQFSLDLPYQIIYEGLVRPADLTVDVRLVAEWSVARPEPRWMLLQQVGRRVAERCRGSL